MLLSVPHEQSTMEADSEDLEKSYYLPFAAAFVRSSLPGSPDLPDWDLVRLGLEQGLRLHKFKRTAGLPRVRRVIGMLRGLATVDLLDIGSGRGVFLWPLLDAFPGLVVTALDRREDRVRDIHAVAAGGIDRVAAVAGDVTQLPLADSSLDGVCVLEVLEHLDEPAAAVAEVLRVARRFVIASVPSQRDDNPEHIHLFSRADLEGLFLAAGARRAHCDAVLNHFVLLATV
jgi:SAM-dependent methyltransferase